MTPIVREALPGDHAAFLRLFPELAVEDPLPDLDKFVRELMPTMLVLERAGRVDGYTYFQLLGEMAYVRHLVTAPEARRTGVARALLAAVFERGRAGRCTTSCLNVKADNAAAIALYERVGLARVHESKAMRITWAQVDAVPVVHDARIAARLVEPAEEAHVEKSMGLLDGQLAAARAAGGRVAMALYEGDALVGVTLFDPRFPGAYPFRAARADLVFPLVRALRPHALPEKPDLKVVAEGQPHVADVVRAAGATLVHDIVHMRGAVDPGP